MARGVFHIGARVRVAALALTAAAFGGFAAAAGSAPDPHGLELPVPTFVSRIYVDPAPGSCALLKNGVVVEGAALYVNGDLCIENEARFAGWELHVAGTIQTKDRGSVGTPTGPVPRVSVRDNSPAPSGCRHTSSGAFVLPCTPAQRVWATAFDTDVPAVAKPTVDLAFWYARARPGDASRGHSCTSPKLAAVSSKLAANRMDDNGVRDSSLGTVELLPRVPYDCVQRGADGSVLGRIQWSGTNPGTLTITGVVFLDGEVRTSGGRHAVVVGAGTVYANDKVVLENGSRLCGSADCGIDWYPEFGLGGSLALIAGYAGHPAIEVKSGARFQGFLYAVGGVKVSNESLVHGQVIADELEAENGADFSPVDFSP